MNLKPLTLVVIAMCALFAGARTLPAQSAPPNLDYVMRAMFEGPEITGVNILGHTFNIKKATIGAKGGTVTVSTRISHTWKVVRDDQIDVSFTKVNGQLQGVPTIKIKEHGWKEAGAWAWKAAKFLYEVWQKSNSQPKMDQKALMTLMGQAQNDIWNLGSKPEWKDVVNGLVSELVLRVGTDGGDSLQGVRSRTLGAPVTVFRDDTYRGAGLALFESTANLHAQGLGDAISAIRIPRGCTVTLYEDSNYKGASIRLTQDTPDFKKLSRSKKHWGDCVSSIRIERT